LLKKIFIQKSQLSVDISKRRIFIGVFLGLFFAVIFYALLKLISKSLVVFDAMFNGYELVTLSEGNYQLYSFFIAFIAVNFSFSIVFEFLVNTPIGFLEPYNYKRKNILNSQRVTNWFLLNSFCRIAFVFGTLSLSFKNDDLFTEMNYIIYLIIIVFIGQMWLSIRWFTMDNKAKIFLIFISVILSITFIISKIELINNATINKSVLSQNILYKHKIDRVTSGESQELTEDRYLLFNLYLKEGKNGLILETDNKNQFTELVSLSDKINIFQKRFPKKLQPFITYVLYIDKDLCMSNVKKIQQYLKDTGAYRIHYSVKDKEHPFFIRGNKTFGFTINDFKPEDLESKAIKISISKNGKYLFQNNSLSKEDLRTSIINKFKKDGFSPFIISYNDSTKFDEYFEVLSLTKNIVNEFRDDYAQKGYNQNYNTLSKELRKQIEEKFYWVFIDEVN